MATLIRTMDWSRTPLGAFDRWPQSLLTTVSLAQASNSPISLVWGPGHTQIYNDGYWPICGAKHPRSMGQDFRECWASAFPVIGEAYQTAWSGRSAYLESMRMFLDRFGTLEETWFTFSFSPITDESGGVGGLFHPVTEMTGQMLSERRSKTLHDLASRSGKARDTEAAFDLVAQTLAGADLDLPFALIYSLSDDGSTARLAARSGLAAGTAASPRTIDLRAPGGAWPVAQVAHTGAAATIEDVAERLGGVAVGPYPEPPRLALALPILQPGSDRPTAVLIAGVSARLRMSDLYRAFYDMLAAAVGTAIANARAHEDERRRVEVLAELDRAKTAFFSNVSHEFRTPLTLILGPLEDELAERERPLPFARRNRIQTAHRNALRLLKLVNTLLDFSRLEAGRVQARFQPTELGGLTGELASVFRSAIEKAGLRLVIECPPLDEPVFVDRDMWEKIVLNLISNAFKHTFEGAIEVRLAWRGDRAELTVADTGIGIRDDELPRLFERFHRVKGARSRSHEGTGIGLALVQELVRLHGGAVEVTSAIGRGSRFRVTIPAGRDHLPDERVEVDHLPAVTATRAAAFVEEALHWIPFEGRATMEIPIDGLAAEPPAAAPPLVPAVVPATRRAPSWTGAPLDRPDEPSARPRVVWADDNADMRDYVVRLLSEHYDVRAFGDGLAALDSARRDPPDLVLSDIMMPRLDGLGLLRELRGDPSTRTVPVLLLSARAGEESALEGLNARADDYLLKPFSARELLARVRTHVELGRMRRQWSGELERANKELETFSYSVSHDLRSPLRAMDGFAALLLAEQGDRLDDQGREYIRRVRAASQRMAAIIDDLLALSSLSRGEIVPRPIDLGELASQVVADLRARDPSRDTAVDIGDGMTATGDARLVTIALENLIGNAWKFTARREGARIWFAREQDSREPVFSVRDNGSGFDMAYAEKLFVPFQRLHTGADFEGTGIGLATVRRIVTRHGGRIWADAAVGRGATFFFTLGRHR